MLRSVLVLFFITFVLASITFASAEEISSISANRKLSGSCVRGIGKSIKGGTDSNPAEGEERATLQGFAEKVESAGALGGLKNKFQGIIEKLKAGQLNTKVASSTKFDFAIKKLQAGKKLTPLDTTTERWQNLFKKLKASGKLKGTTEEQVAKFTKEVAEEVVKKPSKWRYLKTAMKFAFGFALTALIVLGIKGMIGST